MAVLNQTPIKVSTANGATSVFPYDFLILDSSHLQVTIDGVVSVEGVGHSVSGAGNPTGGNVTILTGNPANGAKVVRKRVMPYIREVDYQLNGDFQSDEVNPDQDAPVMMIQQLRADLDLAIKLPDEFSGISGTLPAAVPLGTWRWNGAGNAVEYYYPDTYAGPSGSNQVGFLQAGGGAVARTTQDKMRVSLNPEDFGAIADDATASQPGFLAAVTQALTTGGEIALQRGVYQATYSAGDAVINIDSPITGEPDVDRRSVQLRGQGAGNTVIKNMSAGKYAVKLTGGLGVEAHGYEAHGDFSIVGCSRPSGKSDSCLMTPTRRARDGCLLRWPPGRRRARHHPDGRPLHEWPG